MKKKDLWCRYCREIIVHIFNGVHWVCDECLSIHRL